MSELQIYQNDDGSLQLAVPLRDETLWLSQAQMVSLFKRDQSVLSRHIRNVFNEGELDEASNMQKMHTANSDKPVVFYSLDVIISVGYRVKSVQGVKFRQWATATLKQHLLKGYSLNQQRLSQNAAELEKALQLVKRAAALPYNSEFGAGLVDILASYTQTFLWLQQYDEGLLQQPKGELGGELTPLADVRAALAQLKTRLIARGEATVLFGQERQDGLASIWGNLQQTVFGEEAYPSVESKAAHLLYFVVKNHPFSDGNKRSAAFLFVDFLNRNNRLFNEHYQAVINDTGLAAITLLVAESDPQEKQTLIRLIENLLAT
ncbi:virulence protein RhuM/Fic/DOC family protein [Alkalimonas amylolytica]|uniref:Fic/DOC family protein n=1 Tax=Alkalimonas amylolytica TaxID=152573 RepID=A0A1H4FE31_ALKAM|nr:virulence protein RhuM/Fic/DOC family protein [Alkalimonas amylolytica]SEA95546.1 Fic/DOC family protein [Alkalimonas amylolytica]